VTTTVSPQTTHDPSVIMGKKRAKKRGKNKKKKKKGDSCNTRRTLSSLKDVADLIKSGEIKRIGTFFFFLNRIFLNENNVNVNTVWLSGAGISVSAGIPDFRTKGTGLYSRLEKYELPRPESMFEIKYFRKRPQAFFDLAKELLPGGHKPTRTHMFLKLLSDKGLLQRTYTQNIDGLERIAGVPENKLVEAHGTFAKSYCVDCKREFDNDKMNSAILDDDERIPHCESCDGLVKPGIVFFGEDLPKRFHKMHRADMKSCDLLIVAGTSLRVTPFSELPRLVKDVPRVLINRECVGEGGYNGFDFSEKTQDVLALGNCDDVVSELADLLGWDKELEARCFHHHGRERKPSFVETVVDTLERGMKALKVY